MKRMIRITGFTLALLIAGTAHAYIEEIEKGYEVNELRVVMRGTDKGYVVVRECDSCADITLEITASTRLIKGREEVPLKDVLKYRGQEGVVFRALDSTEVTRIRIY